MAGTDSVEGNMVWSMDPVGAFGMAKLIYGVDAVIKVCPRCPQPYVGWRRILQNFGVDHSRPDDFQVYCKAHAGRAYRRRGVA